MTEIFNNEKLITKKHFTTCQVLSPSTINKKSAASWQRAGICPTTFLLECVKFRIVFSLSETFLWVKKGVVIRLPYLVNWSYSNGAFKKISPKASFQPNPEGFVCLFWFVYFRELWIRHVITWFHPISDILSCKFGNITTEFFPTLLSEWKPSNKYEVASCCLLTFTIG